MTHANLLKALLPTASLDPAAPVLSAELNADGAALDEAQMIAGVLLDEMDPSATQELLTDWERVVGLPDACAPLATTMQERRIAVIARLAALGGQSREFFVGVVERLGYTAEIDDFPPFRAGQSAAGDQLTNENWLFWWMVRVPETKTYEFKAYWSAAGEPLRHWGDQLLECAINKLKPAHTAVTFHYGR
jgi:uncharacterized protein YmfQ (DUF2313 family)